jgi:hypothetical protein
MSKYSSDDTDDLVVSHYTILAIASFVIGGLIEWYVFHHRPPLPALVGAICLLLLFDALSGMKSRIAAMERRLDAISERLDKQ